MSSPDSWGRLRETRQRLVKCWQMDIDWTLYPVVIKNVRM
jgi:hypothetical protein